MADAGSRVHVAVVGPGDASAELCRLAEDVGRRLAEAGAVVVTGGLGGVMAAAARGAKSAGGLTVGLLPGRDRNAANDWIDTAVPTGLGELRNAVVVAAADAVVAVGGSWGTLSEVALARHAGLPVVGLRTWSVRDAAGAPVTDGVLEVDGPAEAAHALLDQQGS